MDNIIVQEFYCNDCPDGGGYIQVRLHVGYNRHVEVVCPKCHRRHPRAIKDGVIASEWTFQGNIDYDEIHVPLSAWSREPRTVVMAEARDVLRAQNKEARDKQSINPLKRAVDAARKMMHSSQAYQTERKGAVIASDRDIIDESWYDRYAATDQEAQ